MYISVFLIFITAIVPQKMSSYCRHAKDQKAKQAKTIA